LKNINDCLKLIWKIYEIKNIIYIHKKVFITCTKITNNIFYEKISFIKFLINVFRSLVNLDFFKLNLYDNGRTFLIKIYVKSKHINKLFISIFDDINQKCENSIQLLIIFSHSNLIYEKENQTGLYFTLICARIE